MVTLIIFEPALRLTESFRGHYVPRLSGLMAGLWLRTRNIRKRACSRRELSDLTDEMLIDIGLSRDAIEREIARPLWR
ncbi:MAG TPA: DUF1127 domain-containing protein [Xanthobacteraceae bacterium]|nr:DUF1127 domain-containing protein [Xanthobacteraceae bacterium]